MSDQATRLQALLDNLENGRMSVTDACAAIRGMNWPRMHGKTNFQQRVAAALNELGDPAPEDSIFPLATEYHAGRIDHLQYEQLFRAYEEAQQRDTGGTEPARP